MKSQNRDIIEKYRKLSDEDRIIVNRLLMKIHMGKIKKTKFKTGYFTVIDGKMVFKTDKGEILTGDSTKTTNKQWDKM